MRGCIEKRRPGRTASMKRAEIPGDLAGRTRSSILSLGPQLGRGRVSGLRVAGAVQLAERGRGGVPNVLVVVEHRLFDAGGGFC